MASIALSVIGCIDYLANGTIFTRAMFLLKKKIDVFFSARKAGDEAVFTLNKSPTFRFTDEQFGTFFFRWCLL